MAFEKLIVQPIALEVHRILACGKAAGISSLHGFSRPSGAQDFGYAFIYSKYISLCHVCCSPEFHDAGVYTPVFFVLKSILSALVEESKSVRSDL
jgi:hypothetical protein